jgi:large subunit ribosomal protein L43
MELVRTQSFDGSSLRLRKFWHTEFPSIQGPWTPFTFRDPKLNITEWPNVSLLYQYLRLILFNLLMIFIN